MELEATSQLRISFAIPLLAEKVVAAHATMFAKIGSGFRVAQCSRSWADSDADYAKGRTVAPLGKEYEVTNAPGGFSWHNFNMAVDCYPFVNGVSGPLDWTPSDSEFKEMVAQMKAQGLIWGGDWHSIKDYPHFQLSNIPASPTDEDRAAYQLGGVHAVWKRYQ